MLKSMKKMTLILKQDGGKFWTDGYTEKDGFIIFNITTKSGKTTGHRVSLKSISEISEQEFDEKIARPKG